MLRDLRVTGNTATIDGGHRKVILEQSAVLTRVVADLLVSLREAGVAVVASSGNSATRDRIGYPACISSVIGLP